tara:strand:- start:47 stop:832 length:786 start_codon:yes stop_codon:yes gene_type:complete
MSKTYNFYYVYAYLREDGRPYYIGKGYEGRMDQKHDNVGMPPRNRRVKLKENLIEEEALQYEMELIKKYGRKGLDEGGILRQTSIGGMGFSKYRTLEEKEKAKKESRKIYNENPKNREIIIQAKKEWREKNREESNRKATEWRATPEGKAKNAARQKKYIKGLKKDPAKFEQLRKIQRASALKISRLRGVKPKEECGRKFKVVSPEGVIYEGLQCKPFAEKHNLETSSFTSMVRGVRPHYKGWKVYKEPTSNKISVTDFMI